MDKPERDIKAWLADCERLTRDIQARLGGNLSVDDLLAESRKDREERGERREDSPLETPPVSPGRGDGM